VEIDAETIKQDSSIADELFNLIDMSYRNIGGHVDFKSAQDIINAFANKEINLIKAVDVDEYPDPDALVIYKQKEDGNKAVASAAKVGVDKAKNSLLTHTQETLNKPSNYGEVSDAMAKVLLSIGVPVVDNEAKVRSILGKKEIIWYGQHPDLEKLKPSVKEIFGKYNY